MIKFTSGINNFCAFIFCWFAVDINNFSGWRYGLLLAFNITLCIAILLIAYKLIFALKEELRQTRNGD